VNTANEIQAERVAIMMRQTPLAAAVTVVNASLMTAVLSPGHETRAVWWWTAVILISVLRLGIWWAYQRRSSVTKASAASGWGTAGAFGAAAAGLLWGAGASWLWPQSEAHQLLWVFLIGGMCAGAAAIHNAHLPTALAFILPAGLPVAARYAVENSPSGFAAMGMILVFLAALTVISQRSSTYFGDNLKLRFDLALQAQELDTVNARLRQEMAERRATEANLRQAQKMEAFGQLTGGIAHDFNNLLTAVLGSLALLRKRLPAGEERAERLVNNAVLGAQRGAALTQRLLAFGRRQALRPEAVDLPLLVQEMSGLLRSSLGAGVRAEMRFPTSLPPVFVDANQLELALLNLAVNARDAMPAGGVITVAAQERQLDTTSEDSAGLLPGDYVVISVSDTGEGMDEATLARAMEPFFTTKGVGKGTGLGLSMVHGLAAQSGGRFALRSRKGAGTVAELWLPQAERRTAPANAAGSEPLSAFSAPPGQSRRVLLVDDDPLVLASTTAMLEDLGHHVVTAESATQALAVLRATGPVDLVITDYGMPGMTGLQLAEALRLQRPDLPVMLATGYGELREVTTAGLFRLSKPFGQDSLAHAMQECMGGASTRTASGGL
jgi:signal transduction histidine kinase/ActR/RegA family two-component response regulator